MVYFHYIRRTPGISCGGRGSQPARTSSAASGRSPAPYAHFSGCGLDASVGVPSHCHLICWYGPASERLRCTWVASSSTSAGEALERLLRALPSKPGTYEGATCSIQSCGPVALTMHSRLARPRDETKLQPTSRQLSKSSTVQPSCRTA